MTLHCSLCPTFLFLPHLTSLIFITKLQHGKSCNIFVNHLSDVDHIGREINGCLSSPVSTFDDVLLPPVFPDEDC